MPVSYTHLGKAGAVQCPAYQGERPAVADARRIVEGGLDPATAGQRDDDQVQERAEGVAEIPPTACRVGADAEVGKDEPADHQDE